MTTRPLKEPSPLETQVRKLARWGATNDEIAALLGLSERTLRRRGVDRAWKVGRAQMQKRLRVAQLKTALVDKSPTMQIWLGKQILGQKDNPLVIEDNREVMSESELRSELFRRLSRIAQSNSTREVAGGDEAIRVAGPDGQLRVLGSPESTGADG